MRSEKWFVTIFLMTELCVVWSLETPAKTSSKLQLRGLFDFGYEWYCNSQEDCTAMGSYCKDQNCECRFGSVFNAAMTHCLKGASAYGDPCEETSQCVEALEVGGYCNKGFCTCFEGYHQISRLCYKTAGLGEKCNDDDDCYANADFAALSCKNDTCACTEGYYQREYRTCRLQAKENGGECTIDLDCRYDVNAKCDKKLGCHVPFRRNEALNRRFRESKTPMKLEAQLFRVSSGRPCCVHKDCIGEHEGFCDFMTKTCDCHPRYFYDPTKPGCVLQLGEDCSEDDVPIVKNSICRFGRWTCKGATVQSKNNQVCLEAATTLDDYCEHDEQCYVFGPDASCVNNNCRCNKNSHYSETQKFCWVTKSLGEECKMDEDCYSLLSDSTLIVCNNKSKTCECSPDTHVNSAETGCVKDVPLPGDPCTDQLDCKGLKNSMCSKGICSCAQSYFESSGKCVEGIDASCESDTDCRAGYSTCIEKRCSCIDKHVLIGTESCLPSAPFGGDCQLDIQCLANTNRSFCNSVSKCNCHRNDHYRDSQCWGVKYLGDVCDNSIDECRSQISKEYDPDTMSCDEDQCRCSKGYSSSSDSLECHPDKKSSNASPKQELFSWIGLAILSTKLMGLL